MAYGVLEGLCLAWILYLLAWLIQRERRHGRVRYRAQATASRWCRFVLTAWAVMLPQLLKDVFGVHVTGNSEMVLELGNAAMVVLLLPPFVALLLGWWWQRGWLRLVALAAGGAALLSLADWMPVLDKRPDVLTVAPAVALAAWELIDHLELRRLLRQTDREIAAELPEPAEVAAVQGERA